MQLRKELGIVPLAYMLEHSNRNNAIIFSSLLAIIPQEEVKTVVETGNCSARLAELMLLGTKGHAGDVSIGNLSEIEAEPAPTGANVEDPEPGPIEKELRCDMALLTRLAGLKTVTHR